MMICILKRNQGQLRPAAFLILILGTTIGPECFRFGIVILFDNSDHDGQIPISLQTRPERLRCLDADDAEITIESTRFTSINFS